MKIAKAFLTVGLVSGLLMGCGTAKEKEELAYDNNRPQGVNYTGNTTNDLTNTPDRNRADNNRTDKRNAADRGSNTFEDAKDIANKITDLNGVDKARVILTGDTAYVGVRLTDNDTNTDANMGTNTNADTDMNTDTNANTLRDDLRDEITKIVKEENNDIDRVYVSEREEFFSGLRDLRGDTLTDGFYDLIDRIFPNNNIR